MVVHFLVQNSKYAYRDRDTGTDADTDAQKSHRVRTATAAALLTSLIADADVVTDWVYFAEIIHRGAGAGEEEVIIPDWIRVVQLTSCICGTISWLAIASDGRMMEWIRKAAWWMIGVCWYMLKIIVYAIHYLADWIIRSVSFGRFDVNDVCWRKDLDPMFNRVLDKLNTYFGDGFRVSSGALLMVGIMTEDVPQIIVTFLVEDAIGSIGTNNNNRGGGGSISNSAYLNLVLAVFDILHKLAAAWDDRNLYIGTGTGAQTYTGHMGSVHSLALVGLNQFVSASTDGMAILWDVARGAAAGGGKMITALELFERSWHGTIAKLGPNKIVTTSNNLYGNIKVFNIESGECLKTIRSGSNAKKCTVASNSGDFFLTSKHQHQGKDTLNGIIRWNAETLEPVQTYPQRADHLVLLDDDHFVSAMSSSNSSSSYISGEDGRPTLWDVTTGRQMQHFHMANRDGHDVRIAAMCKHNEHSFLVASWQNGGTRIDLFTLGHDDPVKTMMMEGTRVDSSLVSVSDNQFVSCHEDHSAVLWDLSTGTHLHTFEGHTSWINDISYVPEERVIVTASNDHAVKVWPIPNLGARTTREEDGACNGRDSDETLERGVGQGDDIEDLDDSV